MGVKNTIFPKKNDQKSGFLLIEAMIALSVVIIFSFTIAYVQSQAACLLRDGNAYCKAANAAQCIFERISGHIPVPTRHVLDGMDIEVSQERIYDHIPYKKIEITVSWNSAQGNRKKLLFTSGIIDEA